MGGSSSSQEAEERRQREEARRREQRVRRKEEEQKRQQLEEEICQRRKELFNYTFGNKTRLDNFQGLQIKDVTQLRIGVFGPTGSGKGCFINTCERTVRQTEKGTAPDGSTGREDTIILQDYLSEMFFRLIDTRGFFYYNANETVEFQNILTGKIQPGDNIVRPASDGQICAAQEMYQKPEFWQRLHGIIIVVKANDPRLKEGALRDYLKPIRDMLQKAGISPITVVTHRDTLKTEEDCSNAFDDASAATGSSVSHTFFVTNYTKDNKDRNPEIEKMVFDILHYALVTAERAVKIMKQREKNKQDDEMLHKRALNLARPDSPDASVEEFLRFFQKEYQWSTNNVRIISNQLAEDDITSVKLLATCWKEAQELFPIGMRKIIDKELRKRDMISE